jgi:hypothetical protein
MILLTDPFSTRHRIKLGRMAIIISRQTRRFTMVEAAVLAMPAWHNTRHALIRPRRVMKPPGIRSILGSITWRPAIQ